MKALSLSILLALATFGVKSQSLLSDPRHRSAYTMIFRLDSVEAYHAYQGYILPDSAECFRHKVDSFLTDSGLQNKILKPGYYVFVHTAELKMRYSFYHVPYLHVRTFGVNRETELRVYDPEGNVITNARVVDEKHKAVPYESDCHCFKFPSEKTRGRKVRIFAGEHFTFGTVTSDYVENDYYRFNRPYSNPSYILPGYFITNKPKYFPGDTVKIKAFLVKTEGGYYKRPLSLYLSNMNGNVQTKLARLKPVTKGAYVTEFILGDTLKLDEEYQLLLRDEDHDLVKRTTFKLEQYTLKRNSFDVSTAQQVYFSGEKLRFFVNAYDINGLPIYDGSLKVRARLVNFFENYERFLFIPNSWRESMFELNYNVRNGALVVEIPDSLIPRASMTLDFDFRFTDAENELHSSTISVTLVGTKEKYSFFADAENRVHAEYINNGKPATCDAYLKVFTGTRLLQYRKVKLPYVFKPVLSATLYELCDTSGNMLKRLETEMLPSRINVVGKRTFDSIYIALNNPDSIEVSYRLYVDADLIREGSGTTFTHVGLNTQKSSYRVVYSYLRAGKARTEEAGFHVKEKMLNVSSDLPSEVLPGQTVNASVRVTDYKGKPVKNANLAAYALNSQFEEINVPTLPELGRSHVNILKQNNTSFTLLWTSDQEAIAKEYLVDVTGLRAHDSLLDFIYTPKGYKYVNEKIAYRSPEFAPFVFKDGIRKQVYAVYLDSVPVYIDGLNSEDRKYSFLATSGYHSIKVRCAACTYTLDSVLLQDSTKLFISIDMDKRPSLIRCDSMDKRDQFSDAEVNLFKKHIIPFSTNGPKYSLYPSLMQENTLIHIPARDRIKYTYQFRDYGFYGPFNEGFIRLYRTEKDSQDFLLKAGTGYLYEDGSMKEIAFKEYPFFFKYLKGDNRGFDILGDHAYRFREFGETGWMSYQQFQQKITVTVSSVEDTVPHYDIAYETQDIPAATRVLIRLDRGLFARNVILVNRKDPRYSIWRYDYDASTNSAYHYINPGAYDVIVVEQSNKIFIIKNIELRDNGDNQFYLRREDFNAPLSVVKPYVDDHYKFLEQKNFLDATHYKKTGYVTTGIPFESRQAKIIDGYTGIAGFLFDDGYSILQNVIITAEIGSRIEGFTLSGSDGFFDIIGLSPGTYTLRFAALGYKVMVVQKIVVRQGYRTVIKMRMVPSGHEYYGVADEGESIDGGTLNPVVIRGSQPLIRPDGANVKTIKDPIKLTTRNINSIANLAAGVDSRGGYTPDFRGARSDGTAYYIDGVRVVGEASVNIPQNAISQVSLESISTREDRLEEMSYTMESLTKIARMEEVNRVREIFRDYAYWEPNLITDEQGYAYFRASFPDNITRWTGVLLAMTAKGQAGKEQKGIRAYKPVSIAFSVPSFLIEGDSVQLVGKAINYLKDSVPVTLRFVQDGDTLSRKQVSLKDSHVQLFPFETDSIDTVQFSYSLATAQGYKDGEQRKIPVLTKAVLISGEQFVSMEHDTQFFYVVPDSIEKVSLTFSNQKSEHLLKEIEKLKAYKYGCTEQTASKLRALLLEKSLSSILGKPFEDKEQMIGKCIGRLENYQNEQGGWGWWKKGASETWLTIYATEALGKAEQAGYRNTGFGKGLAHLKNTMSSMSPIDQARTLELMIDNKIKLAYPDYIKALQLRAQVEPNAILTLQLFMLKTKLGGMGAELSDVYRHMSEDDYGGVYFNSSSTQLAYSRNQVSLLGYRCLVQGHADSILIQKARHHFLHARGLATEFTNTLESASVLEILLLEMSREEKMTFASSLTLHGNQSYEHFPVKVELKKGDTLTVIKKGGEVDLTTAYYHWDRKPVEEALRYRVTTSFRQNNKTKDSLVLGEPVEMVVDVRAYTSSDFMMIEVPIPAGFIYGTRNNGASGTEVHREYFKNYTAIFCRTMYQGDHQFVIKLEPKFTGRFTIPCARVQSMYEPENKGNNETRTVMILAK